MNFMKLVQSILLASLVAMVGLSALAMPTAAQNPATPAPSFTITSAPSPEGPLRVDLDSYNMLVKWKYDFNSPVSPLTANAVTSTTLTWTNPVECTSPGVIVTGSFTEVITFPAGTTPSTSPSKIGESTFTVQVTEEAPGETPITCTMKGKAAALGSVPASTEGSSTIVVKAAYRGILSTSLETAIGEAGPQAPITYNLRVDNLGNSDSNINFALVTNDAAANDGWQPVVPGSFVLGSARKGSSDTSRTVPFQISTPHKNGWNNQETTFQLEIQPSSIKDTSDIGQKYSLTMLARVRGVYVPGFEPLLLVGAVLGTALLARRLRDE